MKKKMMAVALLVGLLAFAHLDAAGAADFGMAVVDGKTSDRVHLRDRASTEGKSLGLFFTGTEVQCASDPNNAWVRVTIGKQSGYMKSDFLYWGNDQSAVLSKQPSATVVNPGGGGWVNLRGGPSLGAAAIGKLQGGDTVTVLGETFDHWYYVRAGSQNGYVVSDYLALSGSGADGGASQKGYKMLYYTQAPNQKSSISIQYPRFSGAGLSQLNALIEQKVRGFATPDFSDLGDNVGLTLDYQAAVTLQNSKMISVVFWGYSDVEGSAHPFSDLFGYNIDLSTMTEVKLTDLYTVNADFARTFFSKAFFPKNPITSYDAKSFGEMLSMQSPAESSYSPFDWPDNLICFLKPDGIVISMPAVHATGSDHFEGQLRYDDIQRFYRPGQKYWQN